jgi:hypothetical protein
MMESTFLSSILLVVCIGCGMTLSGADVTSGSCVVGRYEVVEAHRSEVERSHDQSSGGKGNLNAGAV